jgi:uncharacterized membrane protein YphA (DoxX/SURF4 family)
MKRSRRLRSKDRAALSLRFGLAAIWLWESIGTKLLFDPEESRKLVQGAGTVFARFDALIIDGTCAAEAILGILLITGWRVRLLAWVQIALMAFFMILIALVYPSMYLDPTARIMKNVPIMAAALASYYLGAGPFSLDNKRKKPQESPS